MFGYNDNTITYWAIEAIVTGLMAVVLALGIWRKWRWCAWVYPAGQLLIRGAYFLWQPTEIGYESIMEQAALMLGLCVLSVLMLRHPAWGWVVVLGSTWMLLMTAPSGISDLGVYFTYGYELVYLGLQVIFSILLHGLLIACGVLFGLGYYAPPTTKTE